MGLEHRLVARTHECDHPPSVRSVPAVTQDLLPGGLSPAEIDAAVAKSVSDTHTIYALDSDALLAAKPDVVLTQATCAVCAVDVATVETAVCTMPSGAEIVSFDPIGLDDVVDGPQLIGRAVDGLREGLALSSHMRTRLNWVRTRVAGGRRRRVAAIEWPDPLFAPGHWVPDMIDTAGGHSVFGTAGAQSIRSDMETLASSQPEVVVFAFCGYDLETTIEHADALLADSRWDPLRAMSPHLLAIDGSGYVSRPGPRLVDGVEALAWALHKPHPDVRPQPGVMAHAIDGTWVDAASY